MEWEWHIWEIEGQGNVPCGCRSGICWAACRIGICQAFQCDGIWYWQRQDCLTWENVWGKRCEFHIFGKRIGGGRLSYHNRAYSGGCGQEAGPFLPAWGYKDGRKTSEAGGLCGLWIHCIARMHRKWMCARAGGMLRIEGWRGFQGWLFSRACQSERHAACFR